MIDANGDFHPRTCFVAGTLVVRLKADFNEKAGSLAPSPVYEEKIAIEKIQKGDYVASYDELKGKKSYKQVTELFVRKTDLIFTVVFSTGEKLETTWNHPFWIIENHDAQKRGPPALSASLFYGMSPSGRNIPKGKWIEAKDLKPGQKALTKSGTAVTVTDVRRERRSETVYNFAVKENHTYYVGQDGVLVHNEEKWYQKAGLKISKFINDPAETDKELTKIFGKSYTELTASEKDSAQKKYLEAQWKGFAGDEDFSSLTVFDIAGFESGREQKEKAKATLIKAGVIGAGGAITAGLGMACASNPVCLFTATSAYYRYSPQIARTLAEIIVAEYNPSISPFGTVSKGASNALKSSSVKELQAMWSGLADISYKGMKPAEIGSLSRTRGLVFQELFHKTFGIAENTVKGSGNVNGQTVNHIVDFMTDSALGELKSNRVVKSTTQIISELDAAVQAKKVFQLVIPPGSKVEKKLKTQINMKNGKIMVFDPIKGSLEAYK